jgi:hypothetical protein
MFTIEKEFYMSDLKKHWLGTMNNIVNSYNAEWKKYPFGSRARDKVINAVAEQYRLTPQVIDEVIVEHEYGYLDADDVDMGVKLGIDNPEWEHKPKAFLMFKAIHQLWSHDHSFNFEQNGGYKSW